MNTCSNCGKVAGLHSSILQGCMCQYSMQEPVQFKCTVIDDVHPNGIPLEQWTSPPQRTWVDLTDDDFYGQTELQIMAMKYAAAKLKEKNI